MVLVLMGVSGSGKTAVGSKLADELGWRFHEGDDVHPEANVQKMARGIPLSDADRRPWLDALHEQIAQHLREGTHAIVACSALKEAYRQRLSRGDGRVKFVYLRGDRDLIRDRLKDRRGHFMNPNLLDSQFRALEEPREGITVDIDAEVDQVVARIREAIE